MTNKNISKNSKKNTYKVRGYDAQKTPILANFMNGIEIDMDKLAELEIKNPIK